jgi:hypothetical protein
MKNKCIPFFLIILFFVKSSVSQSLRNEGNMNISAGYVSITGSYNNEISGNLDLDGTLTLTGNWTNNTNNNVISAVDGTGAVIFSGTGTQTIGGLSDMSFNFEGITINSGSTVEVEAGKGITSQGTCNFFSPLILKSTIISYRPKVATFINNNTVNGNITMEFFYNGTGSSSASTGRAIYFAAPISNATSTIFNVAAGFNLLWYQDEIQRKYVKITNNSTPLTVSKGYIIRSSANSNTFLFTGTPNTASSYQSSNIPRVVSSQFYLLGNPYPSLVNWQKVNKVNLWPTIWYRTCNLSGKMGVDTWNVNSKIGTNTNGTASVDSMIPPMQSFWVQVSAVGLTGNVTFQSSDRSHFWGKSTFLKSSNANEKEIFRLYLYSKDLRDENILIQSELAEDYYDYWDSQKMFLNDSSVSELYTLSSGGEKCVIQSIKPVSDEKVIPVCVNILKEGDYKFQANLSESTSKYKYFLEDKLLNTLQDLSKIPDYSFYSSAIKDTIGSRFIIHILPSSIVYSDEGLENKGSKLLIYLSDNTLHLKNFNVNDFIMIYNILGENIYSGRSYSTYQTIPFNYSSGCYIVSLLNSNFRAAVKIIKR